MSTLLAAWGLLACGGASTTTTPAAPHTAHGTARCAPDDVALAAAGTARAAGQLDTALALVDKAHAACPSQATRLSRAEILADLWLDEPASAAYTEWAAAGTEDDKRRATAVVAALRAAIDVHREPTADDRANVEKVLRLAAADRTKGQLAEARDKLRDCFRTWPRVQTLAALARVEQQMHADADAARDFARAAALAEATRGKKASPVVSAGYTGDIRGMAYSRDGRLLAAATSNNTVRVWDDSGAERYTLADHTDEVTAVAFSPSGDLLVSGSLDGAVKVWDPWTGRLVRSIEWVPKVHSVAVTDRVVASGSSDGVVRLWELDSGRRVKVLAGPTAEDIGSLAFGPKGEIVAVQGDALLVWRGTKLDVVAAHKGGVAGVTWFGDTLASAGRSDGVVKLWDPEVRRPTRTFDRKNAHFTSVALTDDTGNHRLAAGTTTGEVLLWDVHARKPPAVRGKHPYEVSAVAFKPSSAAILASAGSDGTVSIWGDGWEKAFNAELGVIRSAALGPSTGRRIATAGLDHRIGVWDLSAAEPVRWLEGHGAEVYATTFSPDERRLLSASVDHTAKIWDLSDGKLLATLDHKTRLQAAAYAPSGARMATGDADGEVKVWSAEGKLEQSLGLLGEIGALQFVDDTHLLVGGNPRPAPKGTKPGAPAPPRPRLLLVDLATGATTPFFGHTDFVSAIDVAPGARRGLAATASFDRTVKVWNLATGEPVATLTGHGDRVRAVAWSPDGERLASGGYDRTVYMWNLDTKTLTRAVPERLSSPVRSLAFRADGKTLLVAARSGVLSFLGTDDLRPRASLSASKPGGWVALRADGAADASRGADTDLLEWQVGDTRLPAAVAWSRVSRPGWLRSLFAEVKP